MTVYRVLNPIIKSKEQKVRNIGWRGWRVSHQTRDGQTLDVHHSKEVLLSQAHAIDLECCLYLRTCKGVSTSNQQAAPLKKANW